MGMIEIKRPIHSTFVIAHDLNASGLTVYASVQNLSPLSPNYLKFWNPTMVVWQTTSVPILLPPVTESPHLYMTVFDHLALSGTNDDLYSVRVVEATTGFADTTFFRFGDACDERMQHVVDFLIPARKEIHRVTDRQVRISCFDADTDGAEVLRVTVAHDPSGAQPEETQLVVTAPV